MSSILYLLYTSWWRHASFQVRQDQVHVVIWITRKNPYIRAPLKRAASVRLTFFLLSVKLYPFGEKKKKRKTQSWCNLTGQHLAQYLSFPRKAREQLINTMCAHSLRVKWKCILILCLCSRLSRFSFCPWLLFIIYKPQWIHILFIHSQKTQHHSTQQTTTTSSHNF